MSVWVPEPLPVELESSEEECPDCGGPLVWEPAGTLLYCAACEEPVFPAGLEPRPGGAGDVRRVPTQAERDDAALELAERRAVILDRIGQVLATSDLRPEIRGRLEWYAAEVGRAATMARVVELAERLAGERIRRRGWLRADAVNPVEILDDPDEDDPGRDDEDEYGDEGEDEYDEVGQDGAGVRALPAAGPPPPVESLQEFQVRNYRIDPDAPMNQCQVKARTYYSEDPNYYSCPAAGRFVYAGVRVCEGHYQAVSTPREHL